MTVAARGLLLSGALLMVQPALNIRISLMHSSFRSLIIRTTASTDHPDHSTVQVGLYGNIFPLPPGPCTQAASQAIASAGCACQAAIAASSADAISKNIAVASVLGESALPAAPRRVCAWPLQRIRAGARAAHSCAALAPAR